MALESTVFKPERGPVRFGDGEFVAPVVLRIELATTGNCPAILPATQEATGRTPARACGRAGAVRCGA